MEEFYTPRGSEEWETWQCAYPDLVSLHSTLTALLAHTHSGLPSDTLLSIGLKRVRLQVSEHCPTLLSVPKRLLALQLPCVCGTSTPQAAYISQLENELEALQTQSAHIECPCGGRREEMEGEIALFRRSMPAAMRLTVKKAQCFSVKQVKELKETLVALELCKQEWNQTLFAVKSTLEARLRLKEELKSCKAQLERVYSGLIEVSSALESLKKGLSKPIRRVNPFGSANIPHRVECKENTGIWSEGLEGIYQRVRSLLIKTPL